VRRRLSVLLLLAAVLAWLSAMTPVTGSAAAASSVVPQAVSRPSGVVVSPDPGHALYEGSGAVVIPSGNWRGDPSGRSTAAGCSECRWRVTELCTKADLSADLCVRITLGCPVGTTPVRVWILRPGSDWQVVGTECQGATAPRTVADIGGAVRDRAVAVLPPLVAGVQPTDGVLVSLPAVFRTGQSARGIRGADLSVLGFDVRLDARVRWRWAFGDGTLVWTSSPGGRWPDLSVSHVYRVARPLTAVVSAVWRGQFTVDGLGPFSVPGDPLVQSSRLVVLVRTAHAHLVG
jgi:hypothetical protein